MQSRGVPHKFRRIGQPGHQARASSSGAKKRVDYPSDESVCVLLNICFRFVLQVLGIVETAMLDPKPSLFVVPV
jgi:hypothetical protein